MLLLLLLQRVGSVRWKLEDVAFLLSGHGSWLTISYACLVGYIVPYIIDSDSKNHC